MSNITLESLIQEHKDRIPLLQENSEIIMKDYIHTKYLSRNK